MTSHTSTISRSRSFACPTLFLCMSAMLTALTLTGCISVSSTPTATSAGNPTLPSAGSTTGVTLHGYIKGGLVPLYGSQVYVFAAGASGYGSAATSMLDTTVSGILPDAAGNGYVATDQRGYFAGAVLKACPSDSTQLYLLATGGSTQLTGSGATNPAITLLGALGSCGDVSAATGILVNEVTTAAMVSSAQQFITDSTHIGTSASNASGLINAFAVAGDLADVSTGEARTVNLEGTGITPQARLNTLADVIAPCTATLSPASASCTSLFSATTPAGAPAPSDTVAAALSIAKNPATRVASIFALINGLVPFQPIPITAPNDYTLAITFSAGGLNAPGKIAVDAFGNAWTVNCAACNFVAAPDSIVGFTPRGVVLSGADGFQSGLHIPVALAFDPFGNLWSANRGNGTLPDEIVKMTAAGSVANGFPFSDPSIAAPASIALDSTGNAWVASSAQDSLVKVAATGGVSGVAVTSPGFARPLGVAIDGNGLIFATGTQSSSILKFNSAGTVLSGSGAGYSTGGLSYPIGLAIDGSDNVWAFNDLTSTVSQVAGATGTGLSPASGYSANIFQATDIAIDGAGTTWVVNCKGGCPDSGSFDTDSLVHLSATGASLAGVNGVNDPHFSGTVGEAIDPSGNIWVSNTDSGTLTMMVGIAAPVKTPIAAAAAANLLGIRP